ncbi:MAG: polysaccharide pyruvyl transferase family protein [Candidatus Tantalella remota]|nr:polysaccharide pyruvyl transferase family protein [Candidatus Tantalella remota]
MRISDKTIELTVVKEGLCIGCGLCATACPEDAIRMRWADDLCWSPEIHRQKCISCGECLKVCPNAPGNIRKCAEAASLCGEKFGLEEGASHFITYDLSLKARQESASGGVLTAVLKYLLDSGRITGVLTSVPVSTVLGEPHYEIRVIRSAEELDKARSSHYYPACYEKALKEIQNDPGGYALVGVPCVIRGLKEFSHEGVINIRYIFGLACSHNVTGRFLETLARQEGVVTGEKFTVDLRDKSGSMRDANNFNNRFVLNDREIKINRFNSAFTAMWRNYFFAKESCLYCPDFYGYQADMSVKDAWGRLSSDPLGFSIASVRNEELVDVLSEMKNKGMLYLERCGAGEVVRSQPQTPRFKQVEVFNRIRLKTVLRKKFSKQMLENDVLRKTFIKNSIEYIYFRAMIVMSNLVYPKWSRGVAKNVATVFYFAMRIVVETAKLLSLGKKVLQGLISPVSYILAGLIRYPGSSIRIKEMERPGSFKVLILGGYGYGNVGDEAQLARVIQNWKRLKSDVDLTVLSPDPEYTQKLHGEKTEFAPRAVLFESERNGNYAGSNILFKWRYQCIKPRMLAFARLYKENKPLRGAYPEEIKLLRLIADSDVVHFGGGGYLTGTTLSRLWDGMLIMNIADILSTPIILSGQTIGICKDKTSKKLAKWGLSKAKIIYLRDPEESKKEIEALGIKGPEVKVTFDDALYCSDAEDSETAKSLERNGVFRDIPYVVVNVHYFRQKKGVSRKCMKRIADICDHIVKKYGYQVVFLPLTRSDVKAIEETRRKMTEDSRMIEHSDDYRIAKGIIGKANFMLTMKHHGIIFAMGSMVPTIAVALDDYYFRKNMGALKLFSQERFLINSDDLFALYGVEDVIDDLLAHDETIRATISRALDATRSMDGEVIERFLSEYKNF